MKKITYLSAIGFVVLFVIGCSSIPEDLGRSDVEGLLNERGLPVDSIALDDKQAYLQSLLAEPLTVENAIKVTLVNNPGLQIIYAGLGISAAEVYKAGRVHNPIFHFSTLDSNESGDRNLTTFGLITSFASLLTLPSRKRLAAKEFEQMKQLVAFEILNAVAEVENAFYGYIAAEQRLLVHKRIDYAANLSYRLAARYEKAGNFEPREYLHEKIESSEAHLECLSAKEVVFQKKTALANILGIPVTSDVRFLTRFNVPLQKEDEIDILIELARKSRLDYMAAQNKAQSLAGALGVTNWSRWLGDLEIGVEHEIETDDAQLTGPIIEWELPIFSQNKDSVLRAKSEMKIAISEVTRLKTSLENDVHLSHAAVMNARAKIAEYENNLLPARIDEVARAQEEENFMLIGTFDLLEVKQEEYHAYLDYLESVHDYWTARVDLMRAVGNTLPSSSQVDDQYIDIKEYVAFETNAMDHSNHNINHGSGHSGHEMHQESNEIDHSGHDMKNHSDDSNTNESEHDAHSSH